MELDPNEWNGMLWKHGYVTTHEQFTKLHSTAGLVDALMNDINYALLGTGLRVRITIEAIPEAIDEEINRRDEEVVALAEDLLVDFEEAPV